ncbi:restriction endonuclease S subunit [Marmoricola sp. OAE513]|uniref:restriction endonuclease subunit S n=1 Tax=Marmoricola sp. OAE513 TaxID=2817894 RepID=UPI001AE18842
MGDVGTFTRGRRFTKADYAEVGTPCIHYGEIYTVYGATATSVRSRIRQDFSGTLRYAKPGDLVIVDVGETVADVGKAVAWLGNEDVAIHDHCFAYKHSLNPAFLAYYLQTARFHADKAKHVARTKVMTLSMPGLSKVEVPVPSLDVQEQVVAVLDRMDALIGDRQDGIPAEIEARRIQFEYYLDRLLSFEVPAA